MCASRKTQRYLSTPTSRQCTSSAHFRMGGYPVRVSKKSYTASSSHAFGYDLLHLFGQSPPSAPSQGSSFFLARPLFLASTGGPWLLSDGGLTSPWLRSVFRAGEVRNFHIVSLPLLPTKARLSCDRARSCVKKNLLPSQARLAGSTCTLSSVTGGDNLSCLTRSRRGLGG